MDEYSKKNKEFINNSHKHYKIKNINDNKYKNNINDISNNNNQLKEYFLNLANQNDEDEKEDEESDYNDYDN